jgi:hypothetical protein
METQRPVRRLDWREGNDGRIEVLRPKFGTGKVGRWISSRLQRPHIAIKLDETGSFVWKLCDGAHAVEEIAAALEKGAVETTRDIRPRLAVFLNRMARRGMIGWN